MNLTRDKIESLFMKEMPFSDVVALLTFSLLTVNPVSDDAKRYFQMYLCQVITGSLEGDTPVGRKTLMDTLISPLSPTMGEEGDKILVQCVALFQAFEEMVVDARGSSPGYLMDLHNPDPT